MIGGQSTFVYGKSRPLINIDRLGLFLTSVDAACITMPSLCADVFAQIVENAGRMADPGGDTCLPEMAAHEADSIREIGAILGLAGVARGVISITKSLPIPQVSDPRLKNLVSDLYKGAKSTAPIGTGSTADAIRNELATGLPTAGTFHSDKGSQYISALGNWLRKNPNASYHDRLVAESLRRDLSDALGR